MWYASQSSTEMTEFSDKTHLHLYSLIASLIEKVLKISFLLPGQ